MTSIEPNTTHVAPQSKSRMTLASLVALVLSLGGNLLQWQKENADLAKTRAEVQSLRQEQQEASTRSIQSWIDQLQKFDTVEDRVMVLSAAESTSPYDSVKSWARDQMVRLEGQLADRKKSAEQEVAMMDRAPAAGQAPAIASAGPAPAPPPRGAPAASGAVRPPSAIALDTQSLAKRNLARITLAQELLVKAKETPSATPGPSR